MLTRLFLLVVACGLSLHLKGQSAKTNQTQSAKLGLSPDKAIPQYQCDAWQKQDGLPQNSVFSITQGEEGYLWLATHEGLVRFDGVSFHIFNTLNVEKLKTNDISYVYEDSQKNLWLGTIGGGLLRYQNGQFQSFTVRDGLPSNLIHTILEDKDKNIWIGTNEGLCKFQDGRFSLYTARDGLSSRDITCLFQGNNQEMWIGTSRGLSVYRNGKFEDYARDKIIFISKLITSICEDSYGNLWIGTHAGLVRWNEKTKEYTTFRTSDGLSDEYITKVFYDQYETLWIGTQGGGLNRVTYGNLNAKKPYFESFTVDEGLSSNSVSDLYEDREGSLWIALHRGGLNRLRDGKFTNYTTSEGLSSDVSNCIYEDSRGDLWIGTVSGGVSHFNPSTNTFTTYTKTEGLASNNIRSITEDNEGNIWLATLGAGVDKLILDKSRQKAQVVNYDIGQGLEGDIVRSIYKAHNGVIFIGTKTGLSKHEKKELSNYPKGGGLASNSIVSILEDSKGNMWLGTESAGLNCIRKDNIIVYNTNNGLAHDLVLTIFEDQEGAIWVGTKQGLSRIKEGEIVNLYATDGLANDAIYSILEDDYGRIWMSSNHGVFWLNKGELDYYADKKLKAQNEDPANKLICVVYTEEDGMKGSDCAAGTQPSALKDSRGHLWFPTTKGIAQIDPSNIKINYLAPPVVIERVMVDNEAYPTHEDIQLEAGKSRFEFHFAALSFLAPTKVKYRYKLVGTRYQEEWVETSSERAAYYTNLPPGNYRFIVQAANNDGVWNEEGVIFSFYLAPFFYQTTGFKLLSVLFLVFSGFGIYYWRVHTLEMSKKALEEGIAKSTQKIHSQYLEITQQAAELETINNIVRTINQEVKFEKVLNALLKQGLSLFSKSHQGIFLIYNPETTRFNLVACAGYEKDNFAKTEFTLKEVTQYCSTGVEIEKDIYRLQPSINLKKLAPRYAPKASLAMLIRLNGGLDGVIFFDSPSSHQDLQMSAIQKLNRFKEHAVSAFDKARSLQELEDKNQIIERTLKKTSDSIRYARRIQSAILPIEGELSTHFKDYFVLYRPKDIVSGDFYWFAETPPEPIFAPEMTSEGRKRVFKGFNDTKAVLAAVDCTGHGVPGAFMTVIGNNLLNSIIIEDKITRSHSILDKLDRYIKDYLKQEEGKSRDGMDMSLIIVDDVKQTIEFAGAKNPLYFIREGELHEIKGSKHPIGGVQIKKKIFESHVLPYKEGDTIYLFSDGFQDQFGGPQDRKFGSKRLKKLLLETHTLPTLQEQKMAIEKELMIWQGDSKQTDDILLIGLKF